MRISIGFSWAAGTWIVTAGLFLWNILAKKWYHVVGDKEYESVIKGWNNLFILYISDEEDYISKKIDYLFAYDSYAIERNEKIYEIGKAYDVKKSECTYQNTCSLWAAGKLLWLWLNELEDMFKDKFGHKPEILENNLKDLNTGFILVEEEIVNLDASIWAERIFYHGNEVLAEWAIASDLWFYSAYPMTPASSIIDTIVKHPDEVDFFQWEDEIAVSMSMLWAHFAGKRAMCGTSWWGFALMTESISYANIAELWGVYIFSQRAGPSTGTPTFTEQWDVDFALHASFGNTYPIVIAPATFEEWYNLIGKALNRSDMYQHPIVFLIDKMYSETYIALDKKKLIAEPVQRWKLVWTDEISEDTAEAQVQLAEDKFARYQVTEDGVSPYTVPWTEKWTFIASSYEHDVYWATSENHLEKRLMTDKRMKKVEKTFVEQEFSDEFRGYDIINPEASTFLVTFGFNRYAMENIVKKRKDIWLITITLLSPIDPRLTMFLEMNFAHIDQLIFVEMNYSGQFEQHVRKVCNLFGPDWEQKITHKRKYDLYPFFEEEFDE